MKPRLMLATGNAHKIEELRVILDNCLGAGSVELLTPADFTGTPEPEEDGGTFEANAALKARHWASVAAVPALADDSGLVVDALGGMPGVLSARYAATAELRNAKILEAMRAFPEDRRTARFVCVAALADPSGSCAAARGSVEGRIGHAPRGAGGFGYDPIFIVAEAPFAGRVMAELTPAEKNAISHRGRALRAIMPVLALSLSLGRIDADSSRQ